MVRLRDGKMELHQHYDWAFGESKQKLKELVDSIEQKVQDSFKSHGGRCEGRLLSLFRGGLQLCRSPDMPSAYQLDQLC